MVTSDFVMVHRVLVAYECRTRYRLKGRMQLIQNIVFNDPFQSYLQWAVKDVADYSTIMFLMCFGRNLVVFISYWQ